MTDTATTTPAGWYDDGSGQQRWWDGTQWGIYAAQQAQQQQVQPVYMGGSVVVPQRKMYKTSHGFHLVMSLLTLGLWLPVWLIVGIYNASKA